MCLEVCEKKKKKNHLPLGEFFSENNMANVDPDGLEIKNIYGLWGPFFEIILCKER